MILSVPMPIWHMLPEHPACSFIGYITAPELGEIKFKSRYASAAANLSAIYDLIHKLPDCSGTEEQAEHGIILPRLVILKRKGVLEENEARRARQAKETREVKEREGNPKTTNSDSSFPEQSRIWGIADCIYSDEDDYDEGYRSRPPTL